MKLKFIKYSLPLALSSSHSSYNSTRQSDRFLIHSSCTVESVLKSCAAFNRSSRLSNDVSCTSETEKEPTEKKQGVLHRQHGRYASLPSLWVLGILTPYSRAILMRTWMVNGFWFLIVRKKKAAGEGIIFYLSRGKLDSKLPSRSHPSTSTSPLTVQSIKNAWKWTFERFCIQIFVLFFPVSRAEKGKEAMKYLVHVLVFYVFYFDRWARAEDGRARSMARGDGRKKDGNHKLSIANNRKVTLNKWNKS